MLELFLSYLPAGVGPGAKLHFATLVIKREPGNVYLTGRLEYAGRDVETVAIVRHHHFRLVGTVETFIGTTHRKRHFSIEKVDLLLLRLNK